MTHWKKLTNPDYLGAWSLEDGKDIVLTIARAGVETVTGAEGKREELLVIHWQERDAKPMVVNSTNARTIEKILKTPYIEQWPGHAIQIGVERVRAFGDFCDALRVRPQLPTAATVKCEKCGKAIMPGWNMNAEQLAQYTRKRYGKALCPTCATEAKNAADKK